MLFRSQSLVALARDRGYITRTPPGSLFSLPARATARHGDITPLRKMRPCLLTPVSALAQGHSRAARCRRQLPRLFVWPATLRIRSIRTFQIFQRYPRHQLHNFLHLSCFFVFVSMYCQPVSPAPLPGNPKPLRQSFGRKENQSIKLVSPPLPVSGVSVLGQGGQADVSSNPVLKVPKTLFLTPYRKKWKFPYISQKWHCRYFRTGIGYPSFKDTFVNFRMELLLAVPIHGKRPVKVFTTSRMETLFFPVNSCHKALIVS